MPGKYCQENVIHADKIHFVRYADDFIVTGSSKDLLQHKVKPLIEDFLKERGLELSEDKTVITHIDDGFDFLGFNVRKYKGKLLIKPAKSSIKRIKKTVRDYLNNRHVKIIAEVNPYDPKYRDYLDKRLKRK